MIKEHPKLSNIILYSVYVLLILLFIGIPLIDNFYTFYDAEYCLLCIGVLAVLTSLQNSSKKTSFYAVDILIGILTVYSITIFFTSSKSSVFIIDFWLRIGVLLLFYLLRFLSEYKNFNKHIVQILFSHFILEIVTGILQYVNVLKSSSPNFKVTGTFSTPNYFGAYICIGILIMAWYAFKNFKVFKKPVYFIAFLSLLTTSIGLLLNTQSRSSWLALIISSTILILIKNKKALKQISQKVKWCIGLSFVILLTLSFYYAYNLKKSSANGRLLIAKIIVKDIPNQPLFGNGLFSFSQSYNAIKVNYFKEKQRPWKEIKNGDYIYHAFNDYLEIAHEIGLFGLGLFITIIFLIIKNTNYKDEYATLGLSLLISLLILALFFTPLTNEYFLITIIFSVLFCFSNIKNLKRYSINNNYLKILFLISGLLISTYCILRIQQRNLLPKMNDSSFTEQELKKLTTILSDNGYSDFFYGEKVCTKFNRKKEGIKLMEKAIAKNNAPKEIKKLAYHYIKEKNYKRAEELFKFNILNEPYRYEARMDLVKLYKKTKEKDKLIPLLKEITDLPIKISSKQVDGYKKYATAYLKRLESSK